MKCTHACCMHACMHVCMHACRCGSMHACMHACMYACMHACMHVCVHACMNACMHICMHICMHVCMHAMEPQICKSECCEYDSWRCLKKQHPVFAPICPVAACPVSMLERMERKLCMMNHQGFCKLWFRNIAPTANGCAPGIYIAPWGSTPGAAKSERA